MAELDWRYDSSEPDQGLYRAAGMREVKFIGWLGLLLGEWYRRRRYRADLRRLLRAGDHLVADIGLSPDAAREESRKPIWRP